MTIHIGMLSDLPQKTRTVVLIGSRTSDHLRELVRIAEFKGRAAYRIETASVPASWGKVSPSGPASRGLIRSRPRPIRIT